MFPRFLKLELDRGSRNADAFEVDEAVIVLIGGRLDEDDRLLELALPCVNIFIIQIEYTAQRNTTLKQLYTR